MAAVLDVVEKLTGYPRDLLDTDLDLEADLGVDTVKQAEVFAAVRERFAIPMQDDLKLRDFPTLAHVIGFARDRTPQATAAETASAPEPAEPVCHHRACRDRCRPRQQAETAVQAETVVPAATGDANAQPGDDPVVTAVLDTVERLTGYPRDLLDTDLDLEADLGIDTVKQAEVFASVRAAFGIARDENLRLRDFPTLGHVIGFARERSGQPGNAAPEPSGPRAGPSRRPRAGGRRADGRRRSGGARATGR